MEVAGDVVHAQPGCLEGRDRGVVLGGCGCAGAGSCRGGRVVWRRKWRGGGVVDGFSGGVEALLGAWVDEVLEEICHVVGLLLRPEQMATCRERRAAELSDVA